MPRMSIHVLTMLLMASALAGCAHKHHEVVYEPPRTMADLAPGLAAPDNGFMLLTDRVTQGRFACQIAIAKMIPQDAAEGELLLVALRPSEEAAWADQLRGVAAVQDLQFLRPLSLRPEGQSTINLCQSARRLGAPLLLVYVPNGLGAQLGSGIRRAV